MKLVPLRNRGWSVMGSSVAIIRMREHRGYAVGLQDHLRSGGVGRVWPSLRAARHRARYLAAVHHLPILEAL